MIDTPIKRRKARKTRLKTWLKTWMARVGDSDELSDARCAGCNAPAPPAPIMSCVSDAGLLVQTWRCPACGNEWTTSAEVPP